MNTPQISNANQNKYQPNSSVKPELSQRRISEWFARLGSGTLRFSQSTKDFVKYNGKYWDLSKGHDHAYFLTLIIPDLLYVDPEYLAHPELERDFKWAIAKYEDISAREKLLRNAKADPALRFPDSQADTKPMLLNLQNATFNLEKDQSQEHDSADFITKVCNVTYDPTASCPTWINFLLESQGNNAENVEYLQKAIGYTLCGRVNLQCLFFIMGPGGTGKSTLIEMISHLMGNYSWATNPKILFNGDKLHSTVLASLKGKRFVFCSEAHSKHALDEDMVKLLTGEDTISARFIRSNYENITPTWKIWAAANSFLTIQSVDDSIWRRLKLIQFNHRPLTVDYELRDKLRGELSGILNWALEGYKKYAAAGLAEPAGFQRARELFRMRLNPAWYFLNKICKRSSESKIGSTDLFKEFKKWCKSFDLPAGSHNAFSRTVKQELGPSRGDGDGNRQYVGISLPSIAA